MNALIYRWLLSIVLIVIVWFHAHWSVALSITLLCVANEFDAIAIRVLQKKVGGR